MDFWEKHKANIGLAILVVYTLGLGVAMADEVFDLGIFPTKLQRLIGESIDKFDSIDASEREAALEQIILYGDFAVPQLIKALDESKQTRTIAITALKRTTGQDLDSPEQWKEWYRQHKSEY